MTNEVLTMHDENQKDKENQDFLSKKFNKTPFYATSSVNIPLRHTVDHKYYYQNNGQQIEKDPEDIQKHGLPQDSQPVEPPSTLPTSEEPPSTVPANAE